MTVKSTSLIQNWRMAMFRRTKSRYDDITRSELYDQDTFYKEFIHNISKCRVELIIESPFITSRRIDTLLPTLHKLCIRGVKVIVNTRHPSEHDETYQRQAIRAVTDMQEIGVIVLYTARHHRKLSIIDRTTVWEGSLNILSYSDSCEIMRKIVSPALAEQTIQFIGLEQYTAE